MRRKKRLKRAFSKNAFLIGIIAVLSGLAIYKWVSIEWLFQSYQELVGFGLLSIIAGIVYLLFGRKAEI